MLWLGILLLHKVFFKNAKHGKFATYFYSVYDQILLLQVLFVARLQATVMLSFHYSEL